MSGLEGRRLRACHCTRLLGHEEQAIIGKSAFEKHAQARARCTAGSAGGVDELPDALFERGVLGGEPLNAVLGPGRFEAADLAHELDDALPLLENLTVRRGEGVFGIECAFSPGFLGPAVLLDDGEAAFLLQLVQLA